MRIFMKFLCIAGIFILNLDAKPNIPSTGYPRQTDYAICLGEKNIFLEHLIQLNIFIERRVKHTYLYFKVGVELQKVEHSQIFSRWMITKIHTIFFFNICKVHSRQIFIEIWISKKEEYEQELYLYLISLNKLYF